MPVVAPGLGLSLWPPHRSEPLPRDSAGSALPPAAEGPAPQALLGFTVWGVWCCCEPGTCLPTETKPDQQLLACGQFC